MPNARRLFAEAVAGGDMGKFEEMMRKGEVGLEGVMKFLNLLGEKAAPFLPQYYSTITAQKGRVGYATEQYTKEFMDAGGSRAIAGFYSTLAQVIRDATPYAKDIGDAFERASRAARVMLLLPGEFREWFQGSQSKDNFFMHYFGASDKNETIKGIREIFSAVQEGWNELKGNSDDILGVAKEVTSLLMSAGRFLIDSFSVGLNLVLGKTDTAMWLARRNAKRSIAEDQIRAISPGATNAEVSAAVATIVAEWEKKYPRPVNEKGWVPGVITGGPDAAYTGGGVGGILKTLELDPDADAASVLKIKKELAKMAFSRDIRSQFPGISSSDFQKKLNDSMSIWQSVNMPTNNVPQPTYQPLQNPDAPFIWNSAQQPSRGALDITITIQGSIGMRPDEAFSPLLSAAIDESANKAIDSAIRGFFPATGGSVIGGRPQ